MTEATELRCGVCNAPVANGDRFCESCGAPQGAEPPIASGCAVCGAPATALDPDGYCSECGARAAGTRDRSELDLGIVAAMSDRGRLHRRNEDAFAVELGDDGTAGAVVCDGISSASAGDVAAREAASAAGAAIADGLRDGAAELESVALSCAAAAHAAVADVPWTTRTGRETPSCTLVAAVCRGREVVVASVGDSRAYWAGAGAVRQLSLDDSWAQEQIDGGLLSAVEAHRDARSHSITHWIGADAPPRPPRVAAFSAPAAGRIVLCTDGLWNYLSSEAHLEALLEALPSSASPAAVARALTEFALERGGRDNITVAVIDIA